MAATFSFCTKHPLLSQFKKRWYYEHSGCYWK